MASTGGSEGAGHDCPPRCTVAIRWSCLAYSSTTRALVDSSSPAEDNLQHLIAQNPCRAMVLVDVRPNQRCATGCPPPPPPPPKQSLEWAEDLWLGLQHGSAERPDVARNKLGAWKAQTGCQGGGAKANSVDARLEGRGKAAHSSVAVAGRLQGWWRWGQSQ